jgi:quercetin dioxygenase-like cupin family protein
MCLVLSWIGWGTEFVALIAYLGLRNDFDFVLSAGIACFVRYRVYALLPRNFICRAQPLVDLLIYLKEANMSTTPKPQLVLTDPVKVDSKHYKVEAENDRVRVLRVTYGPREKSVMHGHPATIAVFLTENHGRFTFPDGRTEDRTWKAGQSMVMAPENHLPENLSDKPLELVLIELK